MLEAFEEACGEFSGLEVSDDRILIKLAGFSSIIVPNSSVALQLVMDLHEGEYIGILSEENSDLIHLRRLSDNQSRLARRDPLTEIVG